MEEVDQQNATCLIVKAAEGVDDALEHIQKTKSEPKTEGLHAYTTCVGATCNFADFDCEHYTIWYNRK